MMSVCPMGGYYLFYQAILLFFVKSSEDSCYFVNIKN